ncbi:hypothetical protein ON010_g7224 [Phytophthora cinnamomi]|nr:hypothetical protein ON010_g7224 [Phytophthora cinnamomi]
MSDEFGSRPILDPESDGSDLIPGSILDLESCGGFTTVAWRGLDLLGRQILSALATEDPAIGDDKYDTGRPAQDKKRRLKHTKGIASAGASSRPPDPSTRELDLEYLPCAQQRFRRISQAYATKADSKAAKPEGKAQMTYNANAGAKVEPAHSTPFIAPTFTPIRARDRSSLRPMMDTSFAGGGGGVQADRLPSSDPRLTRGSGVKYCASKGHRADAVHSKPARYADSDRTLRINGLVEMSYQPDTGAYKSVVPRETIDALRETQPTFQVTNLPTAVEATTTDR